MFLKKIDGPRSVKLPCGKMMTRADLPPVDTYRWVASRKAAVVNAVKFGLIEKAHALTRYGLSEEELEGWMHAVETHGVQALKATATQKFRQL